MNLQAILKMMNGRKMYGMIMVELNSGMSVPTTPLETATIAKAYLQVQGMAYRS